MRTMQVPGMDELEASIARAVSELGRLKAENADLRQRLRALGKEFEDLAGHMKSIGSGEKVDARQRKRIEQKLKSIGEKLA
jgi:predicted RNase H-like nuclease (RuvC/YqgF family)